MIKIRKDKTYDVAIGNISINLERSEINKIKKEIPNAILRTTLIVGFPGESKEDFEDLKDFVKEVKFDHLGVFAFSNEEDTEAYSMDNQVDEKIAKAREKEIMQIQKRISLSLNKTYTTFHYLWFSYQKNIRYLFY